MRLYRLIAILALVEKRGRMKARDLADALETSTRTIYRDVETLCQAGIPLTATSGPDGGFSFMEGYALRVGQISSEDAVNLYLSGAANHAGDATGTRLRAALMRLESTLPVEYAADIRAARERFFYDSEPWWGQRPLPSCLGTLRQSVLRLCKVDITYKKADGSHSVRIVHPYGLVVKEMQWYLVAYCENSAALRSFKADRISRASALSQTYEIPEQFSLEEYWRDSLRQFRQERKQAEHYPVRIRLDASRAWLLDRLEVLDHVQEGDSIVAEVNMHRPDLAREEALALPPSVQVLAPEELHAFLREHYRIFHELYKL